MFVNRSIKPREQSLYIRVLEAAREELMAREMSRERIPRAMTALEDPVRTGQYIDPAWLARRDALLECALAHGYIVGRTSGRIFWRNRDAWSVEAVAEFRGGDTVVRHIRYPVGGLRKDVGNIPAPLQTVLMTRGYDCADWYYYGKERPWIPRGQQDNRNEDYTPVGWWFHRDPSPVG